LLLIASPAHAGHLIWVTRCIAVLEPVVYSIMTAGWLRCDNPNSRQSRTRPRHRLLNRDGAGQICKLLIYIDIS